jgi:DNA-binding GntR family transcriptional regulator
MNAAQPQLLASSQPRYMVLAQALMDDIRSGRYPIDSLLPTELELCQQFNVSRHTVREAFRRLGELGLISRQPGVGTRVKANQVASRYTQASDGIESLYEYVRDVHLEITGSEDVIADEELADRLDCRPGQAWLHVMGFRYVGDETVPIARTDVYIARPYRGIKAELVDLKVPVYSLIEQRYGLRVVEVQQKIHAVTISEADATLLHVEPGSAGLLVIRKYFAPNDELLEVGVSLHPGERFAYSSIQRLQVQSGGRWR